MELEFIERLRRSLPPHPRLRLGIGDDAAVLRMADRADVVVTSDLLADGTHFRLPADDLRRVGRKALAVNLSDLAAMAARPVAAVVSLLLPDDKALSIAQRLYEGLLPLAERFHVAIAGGDTNVWRGPLVISVTALGETTSPGPLSRDGAQAGDAILVTGELGGSRLGKHFDFTPRVEEALLLHGRYNIHAGIDISDGLTLDLSRLCAASSCGALLDLDAIPIAAAAKRWASSAKTSLSPLEHALADGEDFELLLTAPPDDAVRISDERPLSVAVKKIGQCIDEPGLWSSNPDGTKRALAPAGYRHGGR